MTEAIKRLLKVKDENGDFILSAKEVSEAQDKSLNAVYSSRQGECKLDKLTLFDKIKKIVEDEDKDIVVLTGSKKNIVDAINLGDGALSSGEKFEITIRKVK